MEILFLIIPISILLGSVFLAAFILASKTEQFDDMETPALRMLLDAETGKENEKESKKDESDEDPKP
jgi:cbb3-type cytochrome oxidase maturation protein